MSSIDHLCGFISDDSNTDSTPVPVVLPEPCLPPRSRGGQPVPLSQAQAEAKAAANKAVAKTKTSNGYPFATKREIVARLADDRDFRAEALLVLYQRQTDDEVVAKDTKWKNRRGFMSSHAVHGTRIGQLLVNGESLEDEDQDRVWAMAPRYSKQLADHFRTVQLRKARETGDTKLIEQAAKFGIGIL